VWFGAVACAPTFQDAHLVGPGRVQITPSFSGTGFSDEGESNYQGSTFGAQAEIGVSERASLGVGYARFEADEGGGGLNTIAFGPKIGVVKDRFAVAIPASFAFEEDIGVSDTWQLHPMALFTAPVSDRIDFNPSARLLIPLCEECDFSDTLVGFGAGFGVRPRPSVTVRPEFGVLFNPGESGVVWTLGVGVSVRTGR
jgi:hypothetical protein